MVTARAKGFEGVFGAAALSVIKLIKAGFYLDAGMHAMFGAALGYVAYMILGALIAARFTEDFSDDHKTKRNAFMLGILAPSVMLAFTSSPQLAREMLGPEIPALPQNLSMSFQIPFISESYAQTPNAEKGPPIALEGKAIVLGKDFAAPTVADGFKAALGIATVPRMFVVVGKTTDEHVASKTVGLINDSLGSTFSLRDRAVMVRPYNENAFYVTVGSALSPSAVAELQKQIKSWATDKLVGSPSADDKAAASLLLKAQPVTSEALFMK